MPLAVRGLGPVEVEADARVPGVEDQRVAVGVRLDDPAVRRVEGRDETGNAYVRCSTRLETGNAYVRCSTRLDTTIHAAGEPSLAQDDPDVMFQEIAQDGLVGNAFLSASRSRTPSPISGHLGPRS